MLYPPPPQRPYRCDDYGDYIFMVSRLTALKRADLLVRALATGWGQGVRAVIAGDGEERASLVQLARDLGVADRVTFTGVLTDADLVEHLARCRAVCFPPVEEDYGFVTAEAFASAKAVVTCSDSGGPAELVENGVNGFVCEPSPDALGLRAGAPDGRSPGGRGHGAGGAPRRRPAQVVRRRRGANFGRLVTVIQHSTFSNQH